MASLKGNTNVSIVFDRGFVFYDDYNKGSSPFWENIRTTEIKYGESIYNSLIKQRFNVPEIMSRGRQQLETIAQEERNREISLLKGIDPDFVEPTDEKEYIRMFNEIYKNKEQFKLILQRLKNAIERGKKDTNSELRAPTMFSWFISYFNTEFRKNIKSKFDERYDDFLKNDDQLWDEILNESIDAAFKRIENADKDEGAKNKDVYGTGKDYQDIVNGQGISDIMRHNAFFKDLLEDKLHINDVRQLVLNYVDRYSLKNKTRLKKIRKDLKLEDIQLAETVLVINDKGKKVNMERGLTGYLQEPVAASITAAVQNSKENIHVDVQGIKSDKGATDISTFIQIGIEADISKLEASFAEAVNDLDQQKIAENLNNWYNNLKGGEKLDNLFVVNTSNKLYSMSTNHSFSKTNNKIENLGQVLKENFSQSSKNNAGLVSLADRMFSRDKDINNIISLLYNTIDGAFLAPHRDEIKDFIREIFVVAAGNLLFSDYLQIGKISNRATMIHLFDLNDVYIPLSVILKGLSQTFAITGQDGSSYIRISSFYLPQKILYPKLSNPNEYRYGHVKDSNSGDYRRQQVSEAFRKQQEKARQTSFSIRFMSNFKEIIEQIKI